MLSGPPDTPTAITGLFSNKKFYEAVKVYKNLIKQDNKTEDYYLELAICYLYNNDLKL